MEYPEIWFPNLGIKINHLNRVALTVFGMEIYWYGIIIGLGMLFGFLFALRRAEKEGIDKNKIIDLTMYGLIIAIIGARLYYVIFSWSEYKNNLIRIFAIREGGLAIYGGLIAAIIWGVIYTKRQKLSFWHIADIAAPSLALGQAIGRWGNFINREAFGGYTNSLFAMRYLKNQVSGIPESVAEKILTIGGAEYIQVEPTFLYESLWNLALIAFLFLINKKKKFNGQIFSLYLIGYGIGRFWIEGLRTDQLFLFNTGIPVSQVVSLILVALGIFIMLYNKNKLNKSRIL